MFVGYILVLLLCHLNILHLNRFFEVKKKNKKTKQNLINLQTKFISHFAFSKKEVYGPLTFFMILGSQILCLQL